MAEEKNTKMGVRLTDEQLKDMAYDYIMHYPDKKAKDIAQLINSNIEQIHGYNPGLTDCQIRAYKYWNRVYGEENATV